jgi:valyl-tRNA synthetase
VLVHVFDNALRLLHPIVPFITEDLWQRLPGRADGSFLARAQWPTGMTRSWNASEFETLREAVNALRQLRADYAIAPGKQIQAVLASSKVPKLFETHSDIFARMTRTQFIESSGGQESAHILLSDGTEILVPLAGMIDVAKECERCALKSARSSNSSNRSSAGSAMKALSARRPRKWWKASVKSSRISSGGASSSQKGLVSFAEADHLCSSLRMRVAGHASRRTA